MKSSNGDDILLTQYLNLKSTRAVDRLLSENTIERTIELYKRLQDGIKKNTNDLRYTLTNKYDQLLNCSDILQKIYAYSQGITDVASEINAIVDGVNEGYEKKESNHQGHEEEDDVIARVEQLIAKKQYFLAMSTIIQCQQSHQKSHLRKQGSIRINTQEQISMNQNERQFFFTESDQQQQYLLQDLKLEILAEIEQQIKNSALYFGNGKQINQNNLSKQSNSQMAAKHSSNAMATKHINTNEMTTKHINSNVLRTIISCLLVYITQLSKQQIEDIVCEFAPSETLRNNQSQKQINRSNSNQMFVILKVIAEKLISLKDIKQIQENDVISIIFRCKLYSLKDIVNDAYTHQHKQLHKSKTSRSYHHQSIHPNAPDIRHHSQSINRNQPNTIHSPPNTNSIRQMKKTIKEEQNTSYIKQQEHKILTFFTLIKQLLQQPTTSEQIFSIFQSSICEINNNLYEVFIQKNPQSHAITFQYELYTTLMQNEHFIRTVRQIQNTMKISYKEVQIYQNLERLWQDYYQILLEELFSKCHPIHFIDQYLQLHQKAKGSNFIFSKENCPFPEIKKYLTYPLETEKKIVIQKYSEQVQKLFSHFQEIIAKTFIVNSQNSQNQQVFDKIITTYTNLFHKINEDLSQNENVIQKLDENTNEVNRQLFRKQILIIFLKETFNQKLGEVLRMKSYEKIYLISDLFFRSDDFMYLQGYFVTFYSKKMLNSRTLKQGNNLQEINQWLLNFDSFFVIYSKKYLSEEKIQILQKIVMIILEGLMKSVDSQKFQIFMQKIKIKQQENSKLKLIQREKLTLKNEEKIVSSEMFKKNKEKMYLEEKKHQN